MSNFLNLDVNYLRAATKSNLYKVWMSKLKVLNPFNPEGIHLNLDKQKSSDEKMSKNTV